MTTTSNMEGTIVITGAAGGIGNGWLMEHLKSPQAKSHHTIYIIHPTAPGNLQQTLDRYAPKEHKYEIIPLDLSKQEDIRSMGKGLNERIAAGELRRIQLLLLIAGAMFLSPSTKDGISWTEGEIESTFAVNYLANFLLVLLLLRSMDDSFARIIFIGSTSHDPSFLSNQGAFTKPEMKIMFKGKGGVEDVEWVARVKEEIEKGDEFPAAVRRYGRSKLCMTMFMYELQRRLERDPDLKHVCIFAHDPGCVGGTTLTDSMPFYARAVLQYALVPLQSVWVWFFKNGRFRTAGQVGKDLVWCCWDKVVLGKEPRAVYLNGTEVTTSSPESRDVVKQEVLWKGSLELAGLKDGEIALKEWK